MNKLAILRSAEIAAKIRSLDEELAHWTELTDRQDLGLRRHHSQMRRISAVLAGLTESVKQSIDNTSQDNVLASAEDWENQILAAHSIWEVFRSKFILREDELFRDILAACDDLAFACYSPARDRFAPEAKGPPLVYFTATWSPFAISRDSSFLNELRGGDSGGALTRSAFFKVLSRLPIPLVSVPWYDAFYLPGALSIAHEAGHVVASDFDLAGCIAAAFKTASLDHLDVWQNWASEVFADLYGCLCLGPRFVGAMQNLLCASIRKVTGEESTTGSHPPRTLRIELLLAALQQSGHEGDVADLRSTWEQSYGAMRKLQDYKDDIPKVVRAIYAGPYKGVALTDIVSFPAGQTGTLRKIGQAAASGFTNYLELYTDPRVLFAGAQWLHENPQDNQRPDAYQLIVKQIVKKAAREYRGMDNAPVSDRAALDAGLTALEEIDRQTGRDLLGYLQTLSRQPAPPA